MALKAQDRKMRWIMITKTIMDAIFNLQNSHSSTSSLPTKEIFQVNGQIGLRQTFQSPIFALNHEKCCYQSHWIQLFVFFFVYWFSFPSKKVWTSLSVSDTDFSLLAAIIRENPHKLPWIENGEGFAVHSSTRPGSVKGMWRAKIWYFFTCFVTAFLGAPFTTL